MTQLMKSTYCVNGRLRHCIVISLLNPLLLTLCYKNQSNNKARHDVRIDIFKGGLRILMCVCLPVWPEVS